MHSPTLLILAAILTGLMTAVLAGVWSFNRRITGFGLWTLSHLSGFLLCVTLMARAQLPEVVSVVAAQFFSFMLAYLNLAGTRAYLGRPRIPRRHVLMTLFGLLAVSLYFTLVRPEPGIRFALSSVVVGGLFLLCARTIAKGGLQEYPARYLYALACGLHGLFALIRPWLFSIGSQGLFDAQYALVVSQFIVLESIVAIVLLAFGNLVLVYELASLKLRRLAERDPLTCVFNRRSFLTLLDKSLSQAQRMNSSLSMLLVDLDHFKQINDTWGHKIGDEALRHFVSVAQTCVRNEDVLGRIGGEEFAIFLPNTGLEEAVMVANRLRAAVEQQPVKGDAGPIALTASIGVTLCQRGEAPESAMHRADEAMYQAKKNGRNRVEVALPAM